MTVTASAIAGQAELAIQRTEGDPDRHVTGVAPLDRAGPGQLSFATRAVEDGALARLHDLVLICSDDLAEALAGPTRTLLVSANPRLSFLRAVRRYFPPPRPAPGIHPSAVVDPTASVHERASIGAHCFVGAHSAVGEDSILHPSVVLHDRVVIGRRVTIQSGTVIGAPGFGYERNEQGMLEHFPHIGGVMIGDDVEIGSNTSIDRGTLGDTRIGRGAMIDNQIHIAHNCRIGDHAAVIAQAMIGGSVRIGDRAWIAPSAVIMNQIEVGDGATVGLGAVVTKDVAADQTVMGSPAQDAGQFKRWLGIMKQLIQQG